MAFFLYWCPHICSSSPAMVSFQLSQNQHSTVICFIVYMIYFWDIITAFCPSLSSLQILPHIPPQSSSNSCSLFSSLVVIACTYVYAHIFLNITCSNCIALSVHRFSGDVLALDTKSFVFLNVRSFVHKISLIVTWTKMILMNTPRLMRSQPYTMKRRKPRKAGGWRGDELSLLWLCLPRKFHFHGCYSSSLCFISSLVANYPLIFNCYKLFITAKGGHNILVAARIEYLILSDRSSIASERGLNLLLIMMHTDWLCNKDLISYGHCRLI